jgi:hypothetical protein
MKGNVSLTVDPNDYDATLKGGYTILFKVDDKLEYIFDLIHSTADFKQVIKSAISNRHRLKFY